ncbi:hypothetical protein MWU59_12975 [Flavobacteriaceae bacterium F08102]|nr:hypothetical protein [Flavobacteriaceae bacterium F08102]
MKFHRFVSYIFHPVIIPIASTLLYFILVPVAVSRTFSSRVLGIVFVMTYILPILLLYILKKVKLIQDFELKTINERKFPVLFLTIITFLLGRLLLQTGIANILAFCFYGCSLSLGIIYLLFFLQIKISLHTVGLSGLIGFLGIISYAYQRNLLLILMLLFVILGLVASSRLVLKAHHPREIFLGFIIGLASQILLYAIFS